MTKRNYYDRHLEDCIIWDIPLDERPDCTCPGTRRLQGDLPTEKSITWAWALRLDEALAYDDPTRADLMEILGVNTWDAVLARVRRTPNMIPGLHRRLLELSAREEDVARGLREANKNWSRA